jgi:hypothetical protein
LFWFFTFLTEEQYLGLVNFSAKRLVLHRFIKLNNAISGLDFNFIFQERNEFENKFRKNMFRYRLYFVNPIKLTTNFSNFIDKETNESYLKDDYVVSTFFDLYETLDIFKTALTYNFTDLNLLLDTKIMDMQLLKINWFNMDMPFPLNPYIAVNKLMFNSFDLDYEKIYNLYFLSFSHFDSL